MWAVGEEGAVTGGKELSPSEVQRGRRKMNVEDGRGKEIHDLSL